MDSPNMFLDSFEQELKCRTFTVFFLMWEYSHKTMLSYPNVFLSGI